jgi:RNA polymerase sigma-70 factor (ECF subfamily)
VTYTRSVSVAPQEKRAELGAAGMARASEVAFDPSLLDDCIEGDDGAWRQLHRRYFALAVSFLHKLGVDPGDIEDAAQDVFLQMFRYLPRFRRQAELSTWMYRLCITQARHMRYRARVRSALARVLPLASSTALVSTPSLPDDIVRRRLQTALAALSAGERAVFVLYEMEGLRGARIAEILGCPEATVWRRLHYARRAFRRAIGADEDPGDERGPGSGAR